MAHVRKKNEFSPRLNEEPNTTTNRHSFIKVLYIHSKCLPLFLFFVYERAVHCHNQDTVKKITFHTFKMKWGFGTRIGSTVLFFKANLAKQKEK